ncbi:MAG: glycerol-3-phosphate 1-O-acyltransferase PlsY [Opitutaceae bacterium]|nr:glycerol-3-phosphate 1-O-acyltransferase PlsY [Opitutaceae bacterium]
MVVPLLIAAVVGYLLGSLPFGYLVARAKGVNIFEVGSKNPGATNVRRVLGHGPGNLVLALDMLKGMLAVGWVVFIAQSSVRAFGAPGAHNGWYAMIGSVEISNSDHAQLQMITGLVASILGHSFSCFTRFRGGKSVATGAGGFAVLFPLGMAIALGVFLLTLAISRYVSLSSMLGAASLPFAAFAFKQGSPMISVSAVIAAFVIYRHRANILRIRAGTESKVGRKNAGAPIPS